MQSYLVFHADAIITIDQINEKHSITVICVQESLFHSNSNLDIFELRDYNVISKEKHCSEHGGVTLYA